MILDLRRPAVRHCGLALLFLPLIFGCGEATPEAGPPDEVYSMRGKVVGLPQARQREITILHEAVPEFADPDGAVVGMESMMMPFAVAPSVSLDGLTEGDRVAFDVEVRWKGRDVVTVTAIEELPPGTRLEFETSTPEPVTSTD